MFLPLIVSAAELAVPPLRGFKVGHLAESLGLSPDVLLCQQDFIVDFGVEGEFHLAIRGPSASLLPLAPIFLPAEEVTPWDAVFFGDFLGVDALKYLDEGKSTCFTASSFSATVYFR